MTHTLETTISPPMRGGSWMTRKLDPKFRCLKVSEINPVLKCGIFNI